MGSSTRIGQARQGHGAAIRGDGQTGCSTAARTSTIAPIFDPEGVHGIRSARGVERAINGMGFSADFFDFIAKDDPDVFAVDAIFRELPVVFLPGYSRGHVRREDYLALLEQAAYRGDTHVLGDETELDYSKLVA